MWPESLLEKCRTVLHAIYDWTSSTHVQRKVFDTAVIRFRLKTSICFMRVFVLDNVGHIYYHIITTLINNIQFWASVLVGKALHHDKLETSRPRTRHVKQLSANKCNIHGLAAGCQQSMRRYEMVIFSALRYQKLWG